MPKSFSPETSAVNTRYPEISKRALELTIALMVILYMVYLVVAPHAVFAAVHDTLDFDYQAYFEPLDCEELENLIYGAQVRDPQTARIMRLLADEGMTRKQVAQTINEVCSLASPENPTSEHPNNSDLIINANSEQSPQMAAADTVETGERLHLPDPEQNAAFSRLLTLNTVILETEEQAVLETLAPSELQDESGYALAYAFEVQADDQATEIPELDALLGQLETGSAAHQALEDVRRFLERYGAPAGQYRLLIVVNQANEAQVKIAFAVETGQVQIGGLDFLAGSIIFVSQDDTVHWAIPDGQHFDHLAILPLADVRDYLSQYPSLTLSNGDDFILAGLDEAGHIVYLVSQNAGIPLSPLAELSTTSNVNVRAFPGTGQPVVDTFTPGETLEPITFEDAQGALEAQATPQALELLDDLEEDADHNTAFVNRDNYDWYPLRDDTGDLVWIAYVNTVSITTGATPEAPLVYAQPAPVSVESSRSESVPESGREQEIIQDRLNTWPLPEAYGAYVLNCEIVGARGSGGAELDNGIVATYFFDLRYITPNGEEVTFSIPFGMSRQRDDGLYDIFLYGSNIAAMSLPLDGRFAAGTLAEDGIGVGDVVRLTIGNPGDNDRPFIREMDRIDIAAADLRAFAETGDLNQLPLRTVTNYTHHDLPIVIALHVEVIENR